MIVPHKKLLTAPLLAVVLFLQACGGGFASQLRLYLAASGPLVQSLPLSDSAKRGVIADFTELAGSAAAMADGIKKCGAEKLCKLNEVEVFQTVFSRVEARGNFGSHEKLQTVQRIVSGIIASARIYYGGAPRGGIASAESIDPASRTVTEADLKAQLEELKAAMRPSQ